MAQPQFDPPLSVDVPPEAGVFFSERWIRLLHQHTGHLIRPTITFGRFVEGIQHTLEWLPWRSDYKSEYQVEAHHFRDVKRMFSAYAALDGWLIRPGQILRT